MTEQDSLRETAVLDQCGRYFQSHGYGVLRGALSAAEAELCANYALMQTAAEGYFKPEPSLGSQGRYADVLTECLLLRMHPLIERVAGAALFPCYSYLRIYHTGAELRKHLDRPSCEISASMTLGMDAPRSWPLQIEAGGKALALQLGAGDMLLYRGAELPHWRETFDGRLWVQVFLHYVRADGPHADFRFDGREGIGPFDPQRQIRRFDQPGGPPEARADSTPSEGA